METGMFPSGNMPVASAPIIKSGQQAVISQHIVNTGLKIKRSFFIKALILAEELHYQYTSSQNRIFHLFSSLMANL